MSNIEKPINRSTASIIAKCAVIFVVLGVVCFFSIWAWFSKNTSATADGISISAKGQGVQVSWDGVDFYDHLTERETEGDDSDAEAGEGVGEDSAESDDKIGPAMKLPGNPASLKLISGNGLHFFEPYLNRRVGTPILNSDNSWAGVKIDKNNSTGRYIDIDLYFKSDNARTVYLAGDSWVKPSTTFEQTSSFGDFSKGHISAASRIAFLNDNKDTCNFIWAPNSNIELLGSDSYQKIEDDPDYTDITVSGGKANVPEGMLHKPDENKYYIWLPNTYNTDNQKQFSAYIGYEMEFMPLSKDSAGNDIGLYVFNTANYKDASGNKLIYTISNEGAETTDLPFFITTNKTDKENELKLVTVDSSDSASLNDPDDGKDENGQYKDFEVKIADGNFTIKLNNTDTNVPKISFKRCDKQKLEFLIGYNPYDDSTNYQDTAIVLGYTVNGTDKVYDRLGVGTTTQKVYFYELSEQNTDCVIANTKTGVALSTGMHYLRDVVFKNNDKNNINSASITKDEQFSAIKEGSGYEATYTFVNPSGEYLTLINKEINTTTDNTAATKFKLAHNPKFSGPLLKSEDDFYLVIDNDMKVKGVTEEGLGDCSNAFTIYLGVNYTLSENATDEDYVYYSETAKNTVNLNKDSNPPLFATVANGSETNKIGTKSNGETVAVTQLVLDESTGYYTSKIVIRIWVEGTDREAKTPLADGIFNMQLHFTSS